MEYSLIPSILICGVLAGIIDATLTAPGENYRTRALFKLTQARGLKENYRGYSALLLRSLFGATIILAGSDLMILAETDFSFFQYPFIAAFIMGIFSQFFTSPFDVWKNSMIISPEIRPLDHLRKIITDQHLYRGLSTKMFRMGLGSAIVVSTLYALRFSS